MIVMYSITQYRYTCIHSYFTIVLLPNGNFVLLNHIIFIKILVFFL